MYELPLFLMGFTALKAVTRDEVASGSHESFAAIPEQDILQLQWHLPFICRSVVCSSAITSMHSRQTVNWTVKATGLIAGESGQFLIDIMQARHIVSFRGEIVVSTKPAQIAPR